MDETLFQGAADEIFFLMDKDNFARYKLSSRFDALMEEIAAYQVSTCDTAQLVKRAKLQRGACMLMCVCVCVCECACVGVVIARVHK